jgi:hypothetical protein
MARPTRALIDALRATADRLEGDVDYRWTHMGACNCGHLAQTVTELSREELHALATQKAGDWAQQATDYCPASGLPIDHIIGTMLSMGLSTSDLADLERLRSRAVLRRLPAGRRELDYREKADVVLYMRAWAELLEEQYLASGTPEAEAALVRALIAAGQARQEEAAPLVPVAR